ncbi:MAG: AraC family transcriptional regulator [Muribaculaceae bacterium]|nr:AraC family transcriptional regulator [Muribaculaceae bacterium]
MKKRVTYENIIKQQGRSFLFREDWIDHASETGLHMHPEYEMAYLSKGGGLRCINDVVEDFDGDDIVIVPGGVPHGWIFDAARCPDDGIIRDCSCQFSFEIIDRLCVAMPELNDMASFFRGLKQAIKLRDKAHRRAAALFDVIGEVSAARQSLSFTELLNYVYESGEYSFIGSPEIIDTELTRPRLKFNAIHKLIAENYMNTITLTDAADSVGMNKTAFCNAFRRMYGTSFIKFLTHFRMKAAARFLETTSMNVADIAYKVGFNDVPHFNRTFANHFHTTPSKYRREIGMSDSDISLP